MDTRCTASPLLDFTRGTGLQTPHLPTRPQETAVTVVTHSFAEPLKFTNGIYIEENSGDLIITGIMLGYEE